MFILHYLAVFDCSAAKENIKKNYDNLTNLPIGSIVGKLYAKEVITFEEKERIDIKQIHRDKTMYLLDTAIIPSLSNGVSIKLKGFIEAMEESGDPIFTDMAKTLGMYINYKYICRRACARTHTYTHTHTHTHTQTHKILECLR